jgi:hypothetical protein
MSRWWRAYDEAVDDPKLGLLTDRQHRAWFNLVCISSQNGGTLPAMPAVAFKLKLSIDKARSLVAELVTLKLFDIDPETRVCAPHNWKGRQFQSDRDTTATERKRRQRDKENVTRDVTHMSRPPETETETETESRVERARKRGARLPEDWRPQIQDRSEACDRLGSSDAVDQELLKFHDYWKAQPGQRGVKLDWDATWRNWIRNTKGPQNAKTNAPQNALGGFSGLAAQLRRKIADDERRAAEVASRDGSLPGF